MFDIYNSFFFLSPLSIYERALFFCLLMSSDVIARGGDIHPDTQKKKRGTKERKKNWVISRTTPAVRDASLPCSTYQL